MPATSRSHGRAARGRGGSPGGGDRRILKNISFIGLHITIFGFYWFIIGNIGFAIEFQTQTARMLRIILENQ